MKHSTKKLLTLLALTLFTAGAWAQTDYYVVGSFNSWGQNDSYKMTYTDYVNAYTFTLDLETSYMVKVASFDGSSQFYPGGTGNSYGENGEIPVNGTYTIYFRPQHDSTNWFGGYFKVVAGALPDPPDQAIELTKSGDNQWTLASTPDYDIELQVEYAQPYALKNIPEGWTVTADGQPVTILEGDSALITETAQVTLTPDNPRRVKSVTLANEPQNVNIGGITLLIAEGDTWQQIVDRNPGKLLIASNDNVFSNLGHPLKEGSNYVNKNHTYNPSLNYYFL